MTFKLPPELLGVLGVSEEEVAGVEAILEKEFGEGDLLRDVIVRVASEFDSRSLFAGMRLMQFIQTNAALERERMRTVQEREALDVMRSIPGFQKGDPNRN